MLSDGRVVEEPLVTVMVLFSSLTSSVEKALLLGSQVSACNSSLSPFRFDTWTCNDVPDNYLVEITFALSLTSWCAIRLKLKLMIVS